MALRITLHMAGGQADAHAAVEALKLKLFLVVLALLQGLPDSRFHPGPVLRIDVLQQDFKRWGDTARHIAETRQGFITPVQCTRNQRPLPVTHLGELGRLLHAAAAVLGVGNVVEYLKLADRAVRVVERHVEQVKGAPLGRGPFPMDRVARKDLVIGAPIALRTPAMEVFVALATCDGAELTLQRWVEVFDLETRAGDIHPVGKQIENAHQAGTVGRQLLSQRLHALDFADVGPCEHHTIVQRAFFLERQHALVHPTLAAQRNFMFYALARAGTALQLLQKHRLRPDAVMDIAHRATQITGPQGQKLSHCRAETAQVQLGIQKNDADLGAVEQVVVVAVERGQFVVLVFQLAVEDIQILIDRLEFFVGALQLLVGGRQFLIAQVQPLVAGLQFEHHFLQALARSQQLGFQHFRWLARHIGQSHFGLRGHSLGPQGGHIDRPCQHHRLLAKQLVRTV